LGILLKLKDEGMMYSRRLTHINSKYSTIVSVAKELEDLGLVYSELSDEYQNGLVWRLTEEGDWLASRVWEVEMFLRHSLCSGKEL